MAERTQCLKPNAWLQSENDSTFLAFLLSDNYKSGYEVNPKTSLMFLKLVDPQRQGRWWRDSMDKNVRKLLYVIAPSWRSIIYVYVLQSSLSIRKPS